MVLVSLEKLASESIFINEDKEKKWNNARWIKQTHSILRFSISMVRESDNKLFLQRFSD